MRGLEGKVIVIAGAGGIGGATTLRLAQEGAHVVVGDRTQEGAETAAHNASNESGRVIGVQCDISKEDQVNALVAKAVQEFGGVDGLFANAADLHVLAQDTDVLSTPMEAFDQTVAVNLRGHILCTRAALPEILKRGGGSLVFTSSGVAFTGEPTRYSYGATKNGLHGLVRHIAARWGKDRVRANSVAPGLVLTEGLRRNTTEEMRAGILSTMPSHRLGDPSDLAAMTAFLLSDDAVWVTGQIIGVNGGAVMR